MLDLTFEKAFARIELEKDTTRWTVSPKLYSYKKGNRNPLAEGGYFFV